MAGGKQEQSKQARPGETIYKGHRSYDLMRNLQMGIMFSIARSSKEASDGIYAGPAKDDEFLQQVPSPSHKLCSCSHHFCSLEHPLSTQLTDGAPDSMARLRLASWEASAEGRSDTRKSICT